MAEAPEAAAPKKVSTGFGMLATIKMIHAKFSKVKDMPTETLASMLQSESSQEGRKVVMLVSLQLFISFSSSSLQLFSSFQL